MTALLILNIIVTSVNMVVWALCGPKIWDALMSIRDQRRRIAEKAEDDLAQKDPLHPSLVFWDTETVDARRRHQEYAELARKNPEVAKYLDDVFGSRQPSLAGK